MTPTIILIVLIAQFVIAGIGFVLWRKNAANRSSRSSVKLTAAAAADSDRCQVLLGNIGHLLSSHSQLLRFLARKDKDTDNSAADSVINSLASRKVRFGQLLENRIDELSDVLEQYDELYLHERLQLRDYAGRASELENLLSNLETQSSPEATVLTGLVRSMLEENQELRATVEGCRSRISELVAIAMKSGRDARIDVLTQLPNRRAWNERMSVLSETQQLAIAIIDIDNFKQTNDQYGHAAGDAVLRLVAKILREETRVLPFRNGGDEFYLLIESRSADEAKMYVEGIRTRVERASVIFDGKRLGATVTGGVAFPGKDERLEQVLLRADQALYAAKNQRNTVVADPTPELVTVG